jgi:hypothetical protein
MVRSIAADAALEMEVGSPLRPEYAVLVDDSSLEVVY